MPGGTSLRGQAPSLFIGEPNSRYRRPASVARAVERLMLLDAVLATRQVTWLATEREEVAYCLEQRKLTVDDLPSLRFECRGGRGYGSIETLALPHV